MKTSLIAAAVAGSFFAFAPSQAEAHGWYHGGWHCAPRPYCPPVHVARPYAPVLYNYGFAYAPPLYAPPAVVYPAPVVVNPYPIYTTTYYYNTGFYGWPHYGHRHFHPYPYRRW